MHLNLGTCPSSPVLIFHQALFNMLMINSKIRSPDTINISIRLRKGRTIHYMFIICPQEYIKLKDTTLQITRKYTMMDMDTTFIMATTVITNSVFCIIRWSKNIQHGSNQVILQVEESW